MSTLIRSALVALALVGSVSAASAHWYGYGHGHGHGHGYWTKSHGGKWHHNTRAFFDQLKRNGN
jgi:hypothetical protein